jgi:uncharacterized protein
MLTDISEIQRLSKEREKENLRFRAFLKNKHARPVDSIVHKLNDYYFSLIDCTQCGYCCTCLRPTLAESDIDQLIRELKMSRVKFKKNYVRTDEEGDMLFKRLPCAFLKDKKCTVYASRPEDCQSYPHLFKNEFTSRLYGVLENYAICPIVFNVVEDLKEKLNFR